MTASRHDTEVTVSQLLQSLRNETQRAQLLQAQLKSSDDRWAHAARWRITSYGCLALHKNPLESNVSNRILKLEERKSQTEKSTQTEPEVKDEPSKEDKVLTRHQSSHQSSLCDGMSRFL